MLGTLYGPAEVTGDQWWPPWTPSASMARSWSHHLARTAPTPAMPSSRGYAAHPERFRLIKLVDPTDPAVADAIEEWALTRGTVGIRVFMRDAFSPDPADPGINRVLATAAQQSLPVKPGVHRAPRP